MKKVINRTENVVRDMCGGLVLAHDELKLDAKHMVITKKELNSNKVSLISGGGSGHEPAHAGFVGEGLLDAAVCGDVFASPTQIQVYKAITQTKSEKGTLLIIKNYSGDIMNFQNAATMAREDGIEVDIVKVDDDIAVQDSLYTVGRRGVAGTVLVHKLTGAAAQQGHSLSEVKKVAEKTISNVKSIGFALTSCTVPAKGAPTFSLSEDEMEYGVGIHGEPGIKREKTVDSHTLAKRMTDALCAELSLEKGCEIAVLVNGFGATPLMELYLMNKDVMQELDARDITVHRCFVGNYMTSIDMAGASLSFLKLDEELKGYLDSPCKAPGLHIDGPVSAVKYEDYFTQDISEDDVSYEVQTPKVSLENEVSLSHIMYMVDVMSASAIRNEVPFCEVDAHAGDGDFGMSIAKGFRRLKAEWSSIISTENLDISGFLDACSLVIMEHCGGASGPIWGTAFRAAAKNTAGKSTLSTADFADMLQSAVKGIQAIGERSFGRGAVVGDKTLIDAIVPCADAWSENAKNGMTMQECFTKGAEAAVCGAEKTKEIVARMGRAGALGERSLGYPDAGAYGLGVIFTDIANSM